MNTERIVICAANAYKQSYYFNPMLHRIPAAIQEELRTISILFTQEVGGVFAIWCEPDGEITIETRADDGDFYYDEIDSKLMVGKILQTRQELFTALQQFMMVPEFFDPSM
ncbi:MAG: DUF6145 family protein [Clostridium sp.]|nr:DUF6145 family protein [Clostridium sp.]